VPAEEMKVAKSGDLASLEIKQLRFEIMKLRHENKDFAAELEKA